MENVQDKKMICFKLKKMYDKSEDSVRTDALVNRAYVEKISNETINEKVEAQMNAIKVGILEINPKFKEGYKNYDITKQAILESMTNYEQALKELSDFYDGKIEQLIIRKVELQADLMGSLINEEYLIDKAETRKNQKENDKVKDSISNKLKLAFAKITKKKQEKAPIDVRLIENLQDGKDVQIELDKKNDDKIEKNLQEQKENLEFIQKIEKETRLIDEEIKRINERKIESLYSAMEVGEKYLTSTIKKPKIFKKITRFFISKFNTAKVVKNTILEPLDMRIESFKNNELSNMKG